MEKYTVHGSQIMTVQLKVVPSFPEIHELYKLYSRIRARKLESLRQAPISV